MPRKRRNSPGPFLLHLYNVATEIERLDVIDAYGGKSLHEQTHGESFFALFENRFRDNGLYLMDEPEAALSPKRRVFTNRPASTGC